MLIESKDIKLKNGLSVSLRSPQPCDAEAFRECMRVTSAETYFMARYPEEITSTVEMEEERLRLIAEDKNDFMLSAFVDSELVGTVGVNKIKGNLKYLHRGSMGISIKKKYCDQGLGSIMIKEALKIVENTSFEQIELGVFSDNLRAQHVYQKLGFHQVGVIPRAFKLKDGTYRDEIQMVYRIR